MVYDNIVIAGNTKGYVFIFNCLGFYIKRASGGGLGV